jgi:hypothetical protein
MRVMPQILYCVITPFCAERPTKAWDVRDGVFAQCDAQVAGLIG